MDWVTETRLLRPRVHVSRTVVPERSEDVPVRVVNLTDDPVPIRAGTVVVNLDVAEVCGADKLTTPKERRNADPVLQSLVEKVDSSVGREQRDQLTEL